MSSEIGERIVVLGSSGSGKTVLARELAARLGVPHVEFDALRFAEDWAEVPDDVFGERVAAFTEGDAWVVDGNYSRTGRWERAQTVVWLDLSFLAGLAAARRTVLRVLAARGVVAGNRETFRHLREQGLDPALVPAHLPPTPPPVRWRTPPTRTSPSCACAPHARPGAGRRPSPAARARAPDAVGCADAAPPPLLRPRRLRAPARGRPGGRRADRGARTVPPAPRRRPLRLDGALDPVPAARGRSRARDPAPLLRPPRRRGAHARTRSPSSPRATRSSAARASRARRRAICATSRSTAWTARSTSPRSRTSTTPP